MDVISRISELMKKQGLTRYQLAKMSGLSQSTIANMYQRNTIPSVATIETICQVFQISLPQFFAQEGDQFFPMTEKQKEAMDLYLLLDADQQEAILTIMKNMHPKKQP